MNICLPRSAEENQLMAKEILAGVEGETGEGAHDAAYSVFMLDELNYPVLGILYYMKSTNNVFITLRVYQKGKCTRQKAHQLFSFAFEAPLDVYRVTALVSSTNRQSQKLVERFGFHKEGECIGFDGTEEDVTYVYRYTQRDWYGSRFYGKENC